MSQLGTNAVESRFKVSVVTITYNQESYIAQAIDSVLMQECDFDFEYIIGDDASTDGTAKILRGYEHRHPERIRLVVHEENLGAQMNLAHVLGMCAGRYVALLDGDDYWTSPHKLQTQADFMDANPECALSHHGYSILRAGPQFQTCEAVSARARRSEIEDLLDANFIAACTVMYRWGLLDALPPWWGDTSLGDYPLNVLHAQHGWIGYIDEVMATYRVHGAGLWSGRAQDICMNEFLSVLRRLDQTLEFRYHKAIKRSIRSHERTREFDFRCDQAREFLHGGDRQSATMSALWVAAHVGWRGRRSLKDVLIVILQAASPRLLEMIVAFKRAVQERFSR